MYLFQTWSIIRTRWANHGIKLTFLIASFPTILLTQYMTVPKWSCNQKNIDALSTKKRRVKENLYCKNNLNMFLFILYLQEHLYRRWVHQMQVLNLPTQSLMLYRLFCKHWLLNTLTFRKLINNQKLTSWFTPQSRLLVIPQSVILKSQPWRMLACIHVDCTSGILNATTLRFRAVKTHYTSTIVTNFQMIHLPYEWHWTVTMSI